jgi:hypothetical protein
MWERYLAKSPHSAIGRLTEVTVDTIIDVDGKPQEIESYCRHSEIYIKCPRCDATGLEPEPSEYDNPNIP